MKHVMQKLPESDQADDWIQVYISFHIYVEVRVGNLELLFFKIFSAYFGHTGLFCELFELQETSW
jgi:hypothetical protein